MQARGLNFDKLARCLAAPTVGQLMGLCEENYRLLSRMAPDLARLEGTWVSANVEGPDLLIEIQDQCPFTTILRLTHLFTPLSGAVASRFSDAADASSRSLGLVSLGAKQAGPGWRSEPDAQLRVYHDAAQLEVLDLRQTALPLFNHYQSPALDAKWRANLFVGKWLSYCLSRGHRFPVLGKRAHPLRETPCCP